MVVQHNLRAMNSNRMLGLTSNIQSKSTEKLSSGYKINRAADDAAGLSISEKMRKQIRGLTQASLNAADGISTVQTAEGALNEVQDMLQRMNELAVKAANGTMSTDDRSYIQAEIDQLITEIDRVSETTKFNETYLLKGGSDAPTTNVFNYAEAAAPQLVWGEGMQTESGDFSVEYLNDAAATLSFKGDNKVISVDIAYVDSITEKAAVEWTQVQTSAINSIADPITTGGVTATASVLAIGNDNTLYDINGVEVEAANASNYFNVASDGTTVTLKDGIELYSTSIAVPSKLYAVDSDGNSTELDADTYSKFIEVDSATPTNLKVKDGYQIYNTPAAGTYGNQITLAQVTKQDTLKAFMKIGTSTLFNSAGGVVSGSTLSAWVNADGTYKHSVAGNNVAALYSRDTAGNLVEIGADKLSNYVKIETNDALWATKGGETEKVTADNMNDYFEIVGGNVKIKAGVQIYDTPDNQIDALDAADSKITDRIGTKTNSLYDNTGALVAESKLSTYFDATTGKYKGTENAILQDSDYLYLDKYDAGTNPKPTKLGAEEVSKYLNVTPAGAHDINIYAVDNAGKTTRVNEGNMDQFFNIAEDGEVTVKEGFQLYTSPTDTTSANKLADSDVSNYVTGSVTAVTDKDGNKVAEEDLKNYFNEDGSYKGGLFKNGKDEISATEVSTFVTTTTETEVPEALTLKLHVGADGTANNKISVDIEAMSAKSLGVSEVRVDGADDTNASEAIDVIAAAIQKVSKQRSELGAVQNRLEHTIANLDNVVENTTAAESQIRDTDMATEMVKFSNNNILAQAGQAMLAQANQANQGVLSLLG